MLKYILIIALIGIALCSKPQQQESQAQNNDHAFFLSPPIPPTAFLG